MIFSFSFWFIMVSSFWSILASAVLVGDLILLVLTHGHRGVRLFIERGRR